MTKLTQEKIDKYVKNGGGFCPYCGSEQYEGGSLDFESGGIYQQIVCNDCGKDWIDCYSLTSVLE